MRWPGAAGAADSPRDGRSRGLRRIRATVLLIAPMLAGCAAEPVADADVVRCLAPQNRARMVDAAVALNLAQRTADPTQVVVGSRPLSLEQWRDEPDSEFDRACTA